MSVCLRSRELLAIFALRMIGGRSKGEMSVRWMSLLSFCSLSLSLSLSFSLLRVRLLFSLHTSQGILRTRRVDSSARKRASQTPE